MQEGLLYKYYKTHDKITMHIIAAIYFIFALGIFIIPGDILSSYPICAKSVNFMKQYFPNIQIFSDVSPFKQEIEFYTSYMWVVGLLLAAELVFYVTCQYIIFVDKDVDAKENIKNISPLGLLFYFGLSVFGIKVYYTGYIVTNGVTFLSWHFEIDFATKFEIFKYISLFQAAFSASVYFIIFLVYVSFYEFIKYKNR